MVWSSFLALAGAETVLGWQSRPYVYQPGLRVTFNPDPAILTGITGPSHVAINGVGMRGPEWVEGSAYRILAVGGSTTICLFLDDSEAWPQRVQERLRPRFTSERPIWVGNVGKSGRDSLHHLALMEALPEAAQVDVVLILAGVNDLKQSLRLPQATRERLAPSRVFDLGGPLSPSAPYFKQSDLYLALKGLAGRSASSGLEVEDIRGDAYTVRRQLRHAARKDYPLPDLTQRLADYRSTLSRIARLCRERGTRCIFLTQPTMWQDPMPPELEQLTWFLPIGSTGRTLSSADLARAMTAFNDAMLAVCAEESTECLDLARAVPKNSTVFYDDEHFTEAGADIVSGVVAEYLLRPQ
jgi:lysophospholipase L1-like esterase